MGVGKSHQGTGGTIACLASGRLRKRTVASTTVPFATVSVRATDRRPGEHRRRPISLSTWPQASGNGFCKYEGGFLADSFHGTAPCALMEGATRANGVVAAPRQRRDALRSGSEAGDPDRFYIGERTRCIAPFDLSGMGRRRAHGRDPWYSDNTKVEGYFNRGRVDGSDLHISIRPLAGRLLPTRQPSPWLTPRRSRWKVRVRIRHG